MYPSEGQFKSDNLLRTRPLIGYQFLWSFQWSPSTLCPPVLLPMDLLVRDGFWGKLFQRSTLDTRERDESSRFPLEPNKRRRSFDSGRLVSNCVTIYRFSNFVAHVIPGSKHFYFRYICDPSRYIIFTIVIRKTHYPNIFLRRPVGNYPTSGGVL